MGELERLDGTGEVPVLTTPNYAGRSYRPLNAIIEFETVGIASWRDWVTKVVDVLGGRAKTYDRPIVRALERAIEKVRVTTKSIGGDALIDLRISVVSVSAKGLGMSQVLVTGTAITFQPDPSGVDDIFKSVVARAVASPLPMAASAPGEAPLAPPPSASPEAYGFGDIVVPQLGSSRSSMFDERR